MTAKDLKNALLQEAVQGKLVPPACRQAGKLQAKIPSAKDGQWFVYVIECEDGSFYKGFTTDLQKRYEQHCNGTGADWTKTHKPKQLYYWEIHYSEESALQREKYLKSGVGREWFKNEVVDKPENWSSARDLLEEIRKEKSKLVKEGKLKKEKPLPELTEEEIPFDIPENWCWCRLGEICNEIKRGKSPKYADKSNFLAFAQKCNVKTGGIDLSLALYLDENSIGRYSEADNLIQDDIVINSTGGGTMGRVGLYETKVPAGIKGVYPDSHVTVIRSIGNINQHYLYYVLKLNQPVLEKNGTGSTNQTELKPAVLADFVIPLPPLDEQKRIVATIEKFMPLIEEYGKKETELKALNEQIGTLTKKAILQEAVQGKLVPQIAAEGNAKDLLEEIKKEKAKLVKEGKLKKEKTLPEITEDEIPFDIPESWCWCRLGDIVSILGDGIHGTPNYDISGNYYFVNGNNLNNGKIEIKSDTKKVNQSEYEKYKKELNKNTVFVSINGTLGNVAFYENENIILGKSACYFNLIKNEMKKFIYWLIKTKYFLDYANQEATGTTIKNVSLTAMRNFPLPLPPLAEQKRIVAAIEKMLPLCEKLGG